MAVTNGPQIKPKFTEYPFAVKGSLQNIKLNIELTFSCFAVSSCDSYYLFLILIKAQKQKRPLNISSKSGD